MRMQRKITRLLFVVVTIGSLALGCTVEAESSSQNEATEPIEATVEPLVVVPDLGGPPEAARPDHAFSVALPASRGLDELFGGRWNRRSAGTVEGGPNPGNDACGMAAPDESSGIESEYAENANEGEMFVQVMRGATAAEWVGFIDGLSGCVELGTSRTDLRIEGADRSAVLAPGSTEGRERHVAVAAASVGDTAVIVRTIATDPDSPLTDPELLGRVAAEVLAAAAG